MKFATKLFLVFEAIFIVIMLIVGLVITESTYESIRQSEIESFIYESKNIITNMTLYISNNTHNDRHVDSYATNLVDMFSKDKVSIEIHDKKLKLLSSSNPLEIGELNRALTAAIDNPGEQSFLTQHLKTGNYVACFSQYLNFGNEGLVVTVIKDISHLTKQKKDIYFFVGQSLLTGFALIGFLVALASGLMMRPLYSLTEAAKEIARGHYNKRIENHRQDEFGTLADSFNLMSEAIENNIEMLETKNELQQQLFDNLTHELRTPLTSIIGYSELLQKIPYEKETFDKGLHYIHQEGKQMLALNQTLMDLAYYKHHQIDFEKADIVELLEEISEVMALRFKEKEISFIFCRYHAHFEMNKELMRSLLINLFDNACKACQKGGMIQVGVSESESGVNLTIRDNGKGMTAQDLNKIMEPFYRVDKSRSRQEGGLGLGLAIVKQIVERHYAEIYYESVLGEGTTVHLKFPKNIAYGIIPKEDK